MEHTLKISEGHKLKMPELAQQNDYATQTRASALDLQAPVVGVTSVRIQKSVKKR